MEFYQNHCAVFVQAVALWIWFSELGNCRRSAKKRFFHCTNVSLTYQRLLILSTDQLFGRYYWSWTALRDLWVWFILFTMEWRPELVSTALYLRKYLSTLGVKQGYISASMLFNIYFAIVFLVAFYENWWYLHQISDIWQCFQCLLTTVTWSTTERREIRNFPYSSVFELAGRQRLSVKRGIRNEVNSSRPK